MPSPAPPSLRPRRRLWPRLLRQPQPRARFICALSPDQSRLAVGVAPGRAVEAERVGGGAALRDRFAVGVEQVAVDHLLGRVGQRDGVAAGIERIRCRQVAPAQGDQLFGVLVARDQVAVGIILADERRLSGGVGIRQVVHEPRGALSRNLLPAPEAEGVVTVGHLHPVVQSGHRVRAAPGVGLRDLPRRLRGDVGVGVVGVGGVVGGQQAVVVVVRELLRPEDVPLLVLHDHLHPVGRRVVDVLVPVRVRARPLLDGQAVQRVEGVGRVVRRQAGLDDLIDVAHRVVRVRERRNQGVIRLAVFQPRQPARRVEGAQRRRPVPVVLPHAPAHSVPLQRGRTGVGAGGAGQHIRRIALIRLDATLRVGQGAAVAGSVIGVLNGLRGVAARLGDAEDATQVVVLVGRRARGIHHLRQPTQSVVGELDVGAGGVLHLSPVVQSVVEVPDDRSVGLLQGDQIAVAIIRPVLDGLVGVLDRPLAAGVVIAEAPDRSLGIGDGGHIAFVVVLTGRHAGLGVGL